MLRRRKKKGATKKLTSLQKIQLHINKHLGRPTGKLPVLNDQEFLLLQNKMMALRNEKIGSTNKNFSSPVANLFQTPLMLNEPTYPQIPSSLPISIPPVISAGYETIEGQIIPAILPSAAEHIGVRTKQIGAPNENQRTTHSVGGTFGMHAGAGVSRKMTAGSRETPVIAQNIMRPAEYIGPSIAVQKSQVDRYEAQRRNQELARGFKAAGIPVGQDQQSEKTEGVRRVGKPAGSKAGDITNRQIKLQNNLDIARSNVEETKEKIRSQKDGVPGAPKGGPRHTNKMKNLEEQLQKHMDTLARREEEMKSEMAAKGYGRGANIAIGRDSGRGRDPAQGAAGHAAGWEENKARFERKSETLSEGGQSPIELGNGHQMHPEVVNNSAGGYVPYPGLPPINVLEEDNPFDESGEIGAGRAGAQEEESPKEKKKKHKRPVFRES